MTMLPRDRSPGILGRLGGSEGLGLLGAYLMAAGAPTTDPGGGARLMAQGAQALAQHRRQSRQDAMQQQLFDLKLKEAKAQEAAQERYTGMLGPKPWMDPDNPEQALVGNQGLLNAAKSKGMDPGMVHGLLSSMDPQRGTQALLGIMAPGKAGSDPAMVAEYNFAIRNGFQGSFMDYLQARNPDRTQTPSIQREYEWYNNLPPEEQAQVMNLKRAAPVIDLGGVKVTPDPLDPTNPAGDTRRTVTLKPSETAQHKADVTTAEGKARYQQELTEKLPKARQALDEVNLQQSVVQEDIDRALEAAEAWSATGPLAAPSKYIPGTPAFKLATLLESVKANIGFDKLQAMREASPTGGALGQVSDFENKQLQSVMGNLEQAQTKQAIVYNLKRLQRLLANRVEVREEAFRQTFGENDPLGIR